MGSGVAALQMRYGAEVSLKHEVQILQVDEKHTPTFIVPEEPVSAFRESPVRRVVLVVLDGLRPDAISTFGLSNIASLMKAGASTVEGRTVAPSVTACAMASLLTGAAPERHGLQSDRFHIPRPRGSIDPLPRVLSRHSMPSSAFMSAMPFMFNGIAHRIASHLGLTQSRFIGKGCHEILSASRGTLSEQKRGLILMHWPDGDRAGHDSGWMSPAYADAARRMDSALGGLVSEVGLDDPSTLLIALADHGGGGARADHHDSDHALDRTIPIVLAGGGVRPGVIDGGASILDVPATILWALGLPRPESFAGFPIVAPFAQIPIAA